VIDLRYKVEEINFFFICANACFMKILAENKKAYFNYDVVEKFGAGISLIGQEVKSIKTKGVNLAGSYIVIKGHAEKGKPEVFWIGTQISPYQPKNAPPDYNPERSRKLLLKKEEIKYLIGKVKEKGLTLIPLKLYTEKGKIKLEFGIVKGRRKTDKRERIKKREAEREIERELKSR